MSAKSKTGLRYLFAVPRYHTNMIWAVRALKEAGNSVDVVVLYVGATEDHADVEPRVAELSGLSRAAFTVAPNGGDPSKRMQAYGMPKLRWARRVFREVDPDVVVVRGPTLPSSLLWMSLARLHGKRIIIYTQGRMVLRPAYREHLRSFILSVWGAAWITPLRFDDDDLEEAHPRTFYVPFVAPPCQPRARPFPKKDQPIRVLSIGKYVPRKSHTLLVEAMEPSLAGGRATLTLAGEVSSHAHRHQFEAVREAVSSRGLDHAVDFVTNLPFDQTPQLYQSADVFVLPSRDEPAAVSVVEAMSFGLPVVCSTTNGTRCYIQDGYNGFVFRSGDAQALGETLEPLIEDRALLAKLSRHAYVTAAGPLSATAYLQHMSEITRPSEDP